MNAREALTTLSDFVNECDSFTQTFEHEDHGDEDEECRFEQHPTGEAFLLLTAVIEMAEQIVAQHRGVVGAWGQPTYPQSDEYIFINVLAQLLGQERVYTSDEA